MTAPLPQPPRGRIRPAAVGLVLAACVAAFLLNGCRLVDPFLFGDDFQIVVQSWTWEKTWAGLWVPQNEHAMPLGRLLTRALVLAAGRPTRLPLVTALVGPCAVVLGLPLVYLFVKRELGHTFYGVLAVILFGVTAVYQQAANWFAASYSILSLDTLLLALLAAQRFRGCDARLSRDGLRDADDAYSPRSERSHGLLSLGLCAVLCALAPGWFAIGVLAGPLCCLYLLPAETGASFATFGRRLRFWLVRLTPMLGTVAFLGLSLPHNAKTIMHLEHYQMQQTNAVDAFQPHMGILYTLRALVENLLLGLVGVWEIPVRPWLVACVLVVLFAAAGWWWWQARPANRRLMLLGLGLIFSSYVLVYSARARWAETTEMCGAGWSRYNLLPQFGLALFVCGGLPAFADRRLKLNPDGSLTRRQIAGLAGLMVLFFLIQTPRAIIGAYYTIPEQQNYLRYIEGIDACCRQHHIGADVARRVLPRLEIEGSLGSINGWELLWGSDDPVERPDAEVKKILWQCH
jgi:hypothetical protein